MGVLIFLAVLSTLIIVHEWGHYAVARSFGITVERFSIGFGPVVMRKKSGGTEFCVLLIPLGGYVKLAGDSAEEARGEPWEFLSRPAWQRFLVIFAGPLLNAVLAFVIFSGTFMVGLPATTTLVGEILEGYPAEVAGIKKGDRILTINGNRVQIWQDLLISIAKSKGEPIVVEFERGVERYERTITPKVEFEDGRGRTSRRMGRIGIAPSEETVVIKTSFFNAVAKGFAKVVLLTHLIVSSLGMMITGALSFKDSITGPIGIYFMTQQVAQYGFVHLLNFTAILSVSLFVLNLLPIPVLDGGHLLFIVIESVTRRRLSESVKLRTTQAGFCLLMALMTLVIYQDIVRYGISDKLISWFR